ncbi:rubisco methyltransferase family protein [Actinidia rufa]|uniref:Rubisco methyltransferase family protein n=1 Tax=Actinidia rufa TaxID=165716 RepID=A0A7J0DQV1_9ERIC|nr:rubisco methyltransferase family protein [Actinidia rufa]
MATRDLYCITSKSPSLIHYRRLTCAAAAVGSSSPPSPSRLVPHPPDLIKWVRREGGFVHQAVKIAQVDPYGLGLVASEEIPNGSDLIALPHHVPLKFGSLESDGGDGAYSVLVNLARQVPEELWAMRLGLKLLQERAKTGSFWWPYISNLPETYSVPIFFPGEDIKNLQYAPLLHQVNKRCHFLLDFEKEVKQTLENLKLDDHPFGGQDVDSSSLGWAMSAVSSRAFRLYGKELPDGSRANVPMMLPLIDMCNHSFNPNSEIIQEKNKWNTRMLVKASFSLSLCVYVVAGTQIKQDEPLVLNYGCLNNDLFLLDYGFVIPSNPYDCIELKYDGALLDAASMAAGSPNANFSAPAPWQQQILSLLNLDGEAPLLKVSIGGPELVEGRLLAALRVLLANDKEAVQKHDLNTLKSLSAEAPLECQLKLPLCALSLLSVQFRMQKKSVIIDAMRDLTRRVKLLLSKESVSAPC